MYKQNRQKKPGIRLKQLQILKQRTNLLEQEDCYQFGEKLLKFASSNRNLHQQQNKSRSRKKIFGNKDRSLNTSRLTTNKTVECGQNSTELNTNKIDKLEEQIKKLKSQIIEKDEKIKTNEQKLINMQNQHQKQIKIKNKQIDEFNQKLIQLSQQIKTKNMQIATLKLQLQNTKRCNTIFSQNQKLSFRLNQHQKIFSDISDSKIEPKINLEKNQKLIKRPTITTGGPQSFQNFFNKEIKLSPLHSNLLSSFDNQNLLFDKSLNFKSLNQSSVFENIVSFTNRQSNQHIPSFLLKNDIKDDEISQYLSPLDVNMDKKCDFNKKTKNPLAQQSSNDFNFANFRNIQEYYY